jgi:hypothetical protein
MHANVVAFSSVKSCALGRNVMFLIEDLMVDGGCIATTGGRRLFCLVIYNITFLNSK